MGANGVVVAVLRSPLHRMMSRAMCVVEYRGRVSGRMYRLPVQYVRDFYAVEILVGRAEQKRWWRNFRSEGEAELLLARRSVPMRAIAVVGAEQPEAAEAMAARYRARFPRVTIDPATAVFVRCDPR